MRGLISRVLRSKRCYEAYQHLKNMKVIGSIVRLLAGQIVPLNQPRWIKLPNGPGSGLSLLVYPRFERPYLCGDHEPMIQELLSSWLSRGQLFLDVGAHVGFFSLIASRLVGEEGLVVAFEPDAANFARLEKNIRRNSAHRIVAIRAAVSASPGEILFAPAVFSSARMGGTALTRKASGASDALSVKAVTLDAYHDTRTGVVKVDTEGGELQVLQGAGRLLNEGRLRWIVEAHSPALTAAALQILRKSGYACRAIHSDSDARSHVLAEREKFGEVDSL